MKILITGGTGLIGQTTARALRERGHTLRILSRRAAEHEPEPGIEYWPASVTDDEALAGAAADCDVVLHVAGIVAETPPELTFQNVNVQGTRNIVQEAAAQGVRRLVYVSSFGADTGRSDYHKSKLAAEQVARTFPRECIIVRPGNIYGPGDEVISSLVKMVRALPVMPIVDKGDQPFQPVWHEDVGTALARIIEQSEVPREPLNLLGPDVVTVNRLLDIMAEITGKEPKRLPLPSGIAGLAARFAATVGIDVPLKPDVLQMLLDGNALQPGQQNHLEAYVEPLTPVTRGMRKLLDSMPEQELEDGYGQPLHRRFVVDISQPLYGADELFRMFCADYTRFLPVQPADGQEDNPHCVEEGDTITLALPLRGDIPVRVEEAADNAVTLVTVDGHPLAGFVRFTWRATEAGLRFEINVYDRPATLIDTIGMALGGSFAQRQTWITACEKMAEEAKGEARDGVQHETAEITEEQAEKVQGWLDELRASRGART